MTANHPTTVAEAVEAGARAMSSRPVPDKGSDQELTAAVLAAVGYADLLGEVERLRANYVVATAQSHANKVAELEARATLCWEVYGCDGTACDLMHQTSYQDARDALAVTVARVEALTQESRYVMWTDDLRTALHPEKGTDDADG